MATMAPAVTSKNKQAAALRNEAAVLQAELKKTTEKLEIAQRKLGDLQNRRKALEQDAARGVDPKPGVVAQLLTDIAEAQIPVDGLTPVVAEKQSRLATLRANLETLDHEIAIEAQLAARRERFDALSKQVTEAADVIAGKLRALLEQDFPVFDNARDALRGEFIGSEFSMATGPEPAAARALIHELEGKFAFGQTPLAERELLRHTDPEGPWTIRGDIVLTLRNLRPPRK